MAPTTGPVTLPGLDVTTILSFLTGIFLPWAIAAILARDAPSSYKAWFTFLTCFVVQLAITFIGKTFFGDWSPNLWDNVWLVAVNLAAVLMATWQTFARFWSNLPSFQRVQATGLSVGGKGLPPS